jgi:uncharacterized protein YbbK (DUF523 family)
MKEICPSGEFKRCKHEVNIALEKEQFSQSSVNICPEGAPDTTLPRASSEMYKQLTHSTHLFGEDGTFTRKFDNTAYTYAV